MTLEAKAHTSTGIWRYRLVSAARHSRLGDRTQEATQSPFVPLRRLFLFGDHHRVSVTHHEIGVATRVGCELLRHMAICRPLAGTVPRASKPLDQHSGVRGFRIGCRYCESAIAPAGCSWCSTSGWYYRTGG